MDNFVLSGMHRKYIGQLSGECPVANIKNQIFPTISPVLSLPLDSKGNRLRMGQ